MTQSESQDTAAALRELLAPVVEGEGLYLEEINVIGSGASRIVQVLVDLPEETTDGVELDDIARVSRAVSDALDESDAVDGPAYELEVSSPGATRELKQLRHWKRSVGRHVAVTPMATGEQPKFTARLLSVQDAAGDDGATVTLQRSEQVKKGMPVKLLDPEVWPLSSIRRAKVQVQD